MKKPTFYGSTTVGERGQIVLPIKLRKDLDINKGDKLLVMIDHHGDTRERSLLQLYQSVE
jgi:AbrB family looped-hinge helix DNA binding protein